MKNIFLFSSLVLLSVGVRAQEQKVEIEQDLLFNTAEKAAADTLRYLSCSAQSVVIKSVSSDHFLPFKLYDFVAAKENWSDMQTVYNSLQAKVPSIIITSNNRLNQPPNISMRGDRSTIVLIDGIRYDASILNTLNPSDIESITVAPNVAAANYLRNNQN